jgi:lipoate-protein ligase A
MVIIDGRKFSGHAYYSTGTNAYQYGTILGLRGVAILRVHRMQLLGFSNDSWRMDEIYQKIRGKCMYLYRAVDSLGNTIGFWLSRERDKKAAKKFLKKRFVIQRLF